MEVQASEEIAQTEEISQIAEAIADNVPEKDAEPIMAETDWSSYFEGINGVAVIYDPTESRGY